MNEVNQYIYDTLKDHPDFIAVMADRIFPLYAKENTDYPFAVYSIVGEIAPKTKDVREFPISVSLFFKADNYLECCAFSDTVSSIMTAREFDYQSASIEYDDDYNAVISTLIFLIQKT